MVNRFSFDFLAWLRSMMMMNIHTHTIYLWPFFSLLHLVDSRFVMMIFSFSIRSFSPTIFTIIITTQWMVGQKTNWSKKIQVVRVRFTFDSPYNNNSDWMNEWCWCWPLTFKKYNSPHSSHYSVSYYFLCVWATPMFTIIIVYY